MPISPQFPSTTPAGSSVLMGNRLTRGTGCSRMAADTALASAMFVMARPCRAAQASTENFRLMSVAVVMTGVASSTSANLRASSLAPPIWPDSSGITKCPSSSMEITAGSVRLSFTKGAISRTAMPAEPTNTMASAHWNTGP